MTLESIKIMSNLSVGGKELGDNSVVNFPVVLMNNRIERICRLTFDSENKRLIHVNSSSDEDNEPFMICRVEVEHIGISNNTFLFARHQI